MFVQSGLVSALRVFIASTYTTKVCRKVYKTRAQCPVLFYGLTMAHIVHTWSAAHVTAWTSVTAYSVHCTCTVRREVHLHCTLSVHALLKCALTVYRALAQCTIVCTYRVYDTCGVLNAQAVFKRCPCCTSLTHIV